MYYLKFIHVFQCCETVFAIKAFTSVLRLNIKLLPGFGSIRRLICQIWVWFQPQYQNLNSCLSLHTRQDKHTPLDGRNLKQNKTKSNLLTFVFLGNSTLPFRVATPLFPGIPANLPPPFFHTWLIRTLNHYLMKGWSPHFCSQDSGGMPFPAPSLLCSSTNTTFPPKVAKGNPVPSPNGFVCSAEAQRCQAICSCQKE